MHCLQCIHCIFNVIVNGIGYGFAAVWHGKTNFILIRKFTASVGIRSQIRLRCHNTVIKQPCFYNRRLSFIQMIRRQNCTKLSRCTYCHINFIIQTAPQNRKKLYLFLFGWKTGVVHFTIISYKNSLHQIDIVFMLIQYLCALPHMILNLWNVVWLGALRIAVPVI